MSVVLFITPKTMLKRLYDCIAPALHRCTLYFVDNSPEPCIVQSDYPGTKYIFSGRNVGYGVAHNTAIREAATEGVDFHFVLNPDIYFVPGTLEAIVDYLEANPAIGHLMPKILSPDGSLQYLCKLLPSPIDLWGRRFVAPLFPAFVEARNETYELRFSGYDKVMDVPYLSGCFMALRMEALKRVGGFDPRFFMYPEDIDLTRRIHRDFRTVYWPVREAIHDHAKESFISRRMLWIHVVNMIRYFNKWGWIFDQERRRFNRETLRALGHGKDSHKVVIR